MPELAVIDGKAFGIAPYVQRELRHIRKHGLYTPRDFNVSPYFKVIKPNIEQGFDCHMLKWEPGFPPKPNAASPQTDYSCRVLET